MHINSHQSIHCLKRLPKICFKWIVNNERRGSMLNKRFIQHSCSVSNPLLNVFAASADLLIRNFLHWFPLHMHDFYPILMLQTARRYHRQRLDVKDDHERE